MFKFPVTCIILALFSLGYARQTYDDDDEDYSIDPPDDYDTDYDVPRGGSNRRGGRGYTNPQQPQQQSSLIPKVPGLSAIPGIPDMLRTLLGVKVGGGGSYGPFKAQGGFNAGFGRK